MLQGRARIRSRPQIGFVDGLKVQGRYQTKDPLPFTPGSEFAGIVDEAADDVVGFARGTAVMGMARSGALAEYRRSAGQRGRDHAGRRFAEAGASFRTELSDRALRAERTRHAAAAVNIFGPRRCGRHRDRSGADRQAARCARDRRRLTEDKRKFAKNFGADATIDYTRADWREALKELTDGHGADVIFDPVGGEVSVQAFRSIAWNGRHLVGRICSRQHPCSAFQSAAAQRRRTAQAWT